MSDQQQQALTALALASASCTANLTALSSFGETPALTTPTSPLPILHRDLLSLLSLLHAHSTKLALALKPPSTYAAAITPLKEITAHVSALTTCASLFSENDHGRALLREVRGLARDVLDAVRTLVDTFLNDNNRGEEYLFRTGNVHELVDRATGSGGLSKDNLSAVHKRWAEAHGTYEDSVREVGEMIVEAEDEDGEVDGMDDGWGEFGMGGKKMDEEELQRTKKAHALLRMTTLLHKRILLDLLTVPPSSSRMPPNAVLDLLPEHSSALLAASDELVSSLYSPQDPTAIHEAVSALDRIIQSLCLDIEPLIPVPDQEFLETQMSTLSVNVTKVTETKNRDVRKWFTACFEQIRRTCAAFHD